MERDKFYSIMYDTSIIYFTKEDGCYSLYNNYLERIGSACVDTSNLDSVIILQDREDKLNKLLNE